MRKDAALSDTCNDVKHVRVAVFGSDTTSAVGVQRYEYTDDLVENAIKSVIPISQIDSRCTLSKAFLKSMKLIARDFWNS